METTIANGANLDTGSANVEPTTYTQGSKSDQHLETGSTSERTFTQTEVNAMMAREKDQGKKSILKELGVEDVKNAKDALDKYKEYLNSQKSDLQKAQEIAAETEKNRKALEEQLLASNQKLSAIIAGCPPEKVDDICILARSRMSDKINFEQALELIKQGYPDMFTSSPQTKGTGSNISVQTKGNTQQIESFGQRLASQHRVTTKNPYFKS